MSELKGYLKKYYDFLDKEPIWMISLLPGFLSYMLARLISDFGDLNTLEQTLAFIGFSITSSLFALFTYRVRSSIAHRINKRKKKSSVGQMDSFSSTFFLIILIFYSIVIGISTGLIINKNVIEEFYVGAPFL